MSVHSAHGIRFCNEEGDFRVELIHIGPCDQTTDHGRECVLLDWMENDGTDLIRGEVVVPVRVEWPAGEEGPLMYLQPTEDSDA